MNTKLKTFTILLCICLLSGFASAQEATVKGVVVDFQTNTPIQGAVISAGDVSTNSSEDGTFSFKIEQGKYLLTITAEGYEPLNKDIFVTEAEFELDPSRMIIPGTKPNVGIADESVVSLSSLESDKVDQNISGILVNSQDFVVSTAAYNLGFAGFKFRGYGSDYYDVFINGIPMNQPETNRPVWSEWGGLNDAMRNQESNNGLTPAHYGFGHVGGSSNINTRPTLMGRQHKFSYASSNRSYNNRVTYTYGSGLLKNNWAFSFNGSKRWAEEGYVQGTWYDAWSASFAAEKRFNEQNSLVITAFASPYRRALQAPSTQEAYDLVDNNYYNPNWGWQEGEKRNAKVRKLFKPTIIVNHYWNPNSKIRINNAVSYSYSDYGTTALNWYDASDPRPDYYRYLPSYQTDPYIQGLITEQWQTDESVSQINWDEMYQINYLQNLEDKQSKYIIENKKTISQTINWAPNMRYDLNKNITLFGGLSVQHYRSENFKQIEDLLGGEYWIDIDQFAERDFAGDTAILINDLQNPDKQLVEGDKYGYHYILTRNKAAHWGMAQFSYTDFDVYAAYNVAFTQYQRDGKMQNGRYPDNSLGKSEAKSFVNFSIKSGLTYKFSGKDFFKINVAYLTLPPALNDIFVMPTIANTYISNIENEQILSGDVSYVRSGRKFSGRLTLYQTYFENQTSSIGFYHDDLRTFVNYTQSGIDKVHQGIEAGVSIEVYQGLQWITYTNIGNYVFTSRPEATISYSNGSKPDTTKTIYSKYFYDFSGPQFAATSGFRYNSNKFWFLNVFVNYIDKNYMSFNPERRTESAIANLGEGDPLITEITEQYRFEAGYTVDLSFGKSWKIKNQYINLNIGVNNVLNNQELRTGGFEQMRYDFETQNVSKFQPKYFYAYGRNYFAMVSYRF